MYKPYVYIYIYRYICIDIRTYTGLLLEELGLVLELAGRARRGHLDRRPRHGAALRYALALCIYIYIYIYRERER